MKRLNIKTKYEKKQENKKETLKLLNRGISINEISIILNCSERTIRNYVNELLKENKFTQSEKIRCIELNIIFDSIIEASEYVDCYPLEILKCLKGKQIISGGYHWEYVHEDRN